MKKLIISAIAAASLLFGFASCSGDLHDAEPLKGLLDNSDICGSIEGWSGSELTKINENGEYSFEFTADDDNAQFSIRKIAGSWNGGRWCGALTKDEDNALSIKPGDTTSYIKMIYSEDPDPSHVKITGLSINSKYTLKFKTDLSSQSVEVILEGDGAAKPADTKTPYYFDGLYLVGGVFKLEGKDNAYAFDTTNLLWGATTDKKTGVVTYTKDIVATAASGELGINDSSWNNKQNGSGVTIAAGEAAKPLNGKEGNFKVTGLTIGNPYRVTITTTPEKVVSVGIEEICAYTLKFKVTGLSEGDQVFINGTPWGSSWPNGWPILEWNSGKPAAKSVVIADSDGVATFDSTWDVENVTKPGETLSYEAKLVYIADGEDWNATGTVINAFGNFSFDVEIVSAGTYLVTIDLASEEVTAEKQ